MIVGELIERLREFDPDSEVVIGMKQRYGSDFAMEIDNVTFERVDVWDGDEDAPCVVITEGRQVGSVSYDENEIR